MNDDLEKKLIFKVDLEAKEYFGKKNKKSVPQQKESPSLESKDQASYETNFTGLKDHFKSRLVFFDYKTDFFKKLMHQLNADLKHKIIKDVESLPREIQGRQEVLLFLNYTSYPRLCQQLIPKIKVKFDNVTIVLVSKNLTADQVKKHRASDYAVDDYLSFPFTKEDFYRILLKHN